MSARQAHGRIGGPGPLRFRARRLLLLLCLSCGPALAFAQDFDPTDKSWHGLSTLLQTAAEVKLQVTVGAALDWSKVDGQAILVVIAPAVAPQGEALASLVRFVEGGGRLVVADDFGAGAAWLLPFGLELFDAPVKAATYYENLPYLPQVQVDPAPAAERAARRWMAPRARIAPGQFLRHNLHAPIVLNHPATVRVAAGRDGVVWGRYADSGPGADATHGWLAEADLGSGRVLALADPSLWLNAMLARFHDNKQFAANVLRYYCVLDRPCTVHLLANVTAVTGSYQARARPPSTSLGAGLVHLEALLQALAAALRGALMGPVLVFVVLALLGVPALWLARARAPVLPPRPTHVRSNSILFDTIGAWLAQGQADYRRPARLLASHLARLVSQVEDRRRLDQGDLGRSPARTAASLAAAGSAGFAQPLRAQAVDTWVRRGQCSEQAGVRLREIFADLQKVADEEGEPIGRVRFGQLAGEVEWAEALLRHTRDPEASSDS